MRVYHFLPSHFALSDIALHRIRISRLCEVNDPFELLALNTGGRKDFRQALAHWKSDLNSSKGIVCFSASWQNPVLWSHYSAKHRGMCLGFDLCDENARKVEYASDLILAHFEADPSQVELDEALVDALLHTKYAHWSYEDEVRMFIDLDQGIYENGSYFLPFSAKLVLREVVVGALCEVSVEIIRDLVDRLYKGVQVSKARLAFKEFRVVPDEGRDHLSVPQTEVR